MHHERNQSHHPSEQVAAAAQIPAQHAGLSGDDHLSGRGCSAPSRHGPPVSIKDELTDFTRKVRIEIVCPDEIADRIVECITEVAQTGQLGDGIVWVTEISRAIFVHKTTVGSPPDPRRL